MPAQTGTAWPTQGPQRSRRVLETDPAGVAVGIESGEDAAGVEFAAVGLVAIRAAGELHVRKAAAQRVRTRFDVAFRYEGMVQVELQRNIRLRDRIDDRERLLRGRQDVARIIASVERLDQQRDARSRAAHRRTPQIRDQGRFVRSRRYSIDTPARHRVQPRASTRRCIGEGLVERPGAPRSPVRRPRGRRAGD